MMTHKDESKFLEWQPCLFPVRVICFVYVNIPTVLIYLMM